MKSSVEKLPKLIDFLKDRKASPSKIAKELKADRRTVNKLLEVAMEIGIVGCESIEIEGRKYRVCGLTPAFKKMLE